MVAEVRRVCALSIVADVASMTAFYCGMGFDPVQSGDSRCVGLRASKTYLILTSVDLMEAEYPTVDMASLTGRTIPYVWITPLEEALAALPPSAAIVARACCSNEALIRQDGQMLVLAGGSEERT